jgi:molybdopterin-dependent oxidoreductase alpha subunit
MADSNERSGERPGVKVKEPAAGPFFEPYDSPAGGWGALKAFAEALREQSVVLKGSKTLLSMNQPSGFDCPGCAWPDPKHTSSFEFCENGAKALAFELTKRRMTREFFAAYTVSELAQHSDYWLEEQGRLTEPMRYDAASDHYVPVSWEEAFTTVARCLKSLHSPDEAEFYTSGRASNEAAFVYQLFARRFGTNNFPDCSNMCHEATSVGLPESIGIGKGTVLLEDFATTDAIFVMGQNPGTNSPRMMTSLRDAARRGVPIVAINPLRERALERFAAPQSEIEMLTFSSTPIAHEYCQVKVGGDVALLKGMMKVMFERHASSPTNGGSAIFDMPFIERHTLGFEALAEDIRVTEWADILNVSGISRDQIERITNTYIQAQATIFVYGMGLTQHRHGTGAVQQAANLLLLRGNFGHAGAGICPVRGHSNVQGDRTVGIDEKPSPAFLEQIEKVFGFRPPQQHGHAVVDALQAMIDGRAKVFVGLGGNFAAAVPETELVHAAMRRLQLTVGINTKLNRGHLVHGREALILPCLARSDLDEQATGLQSVTVEDSMSMVHASGGLVEPPSPHLKSEVAIICGMAHATLPDSGIEWDRFAGNYDLIRDKIEAVFPSLFAQFNAKIRQPGGFHLYNGPRELTWNTASKRANFIVYPGLAEEPAVADGRALRLTTIRSHEQYNTTIYTLNDRYRGVFEGRRVLFMNADDMAERHIDAQALVEIESLADTDRRRSVSGFKVKPYSIPRGSVAAYYPETNDLLPLSHHDPRSKTPSAKSIPVLVRTVTPASA